jgi:hypothetical protein
VSGAVLHGRTLLVVERDPVRAGRLIMALRALGAQAVRWSDEERGRSQARSLRPDVVLVDAAGVDDWAKPALAAIAAEPALASATVVRTDAKALWNGEEPAASVLEALVTAVARRAERDTKSLRAVTTPSEAVAPPKIEPPPKTEVAPGARRVASARSTEKYGAVGKPEAALPPVIAPPAIEPAMIPPPVIAPAVLAEPAKPPGYVFPTRRKADVEEESSSKATSLDLTAVPSSILERANLPDTDRFARTTPERRWLPWVIGITALLAVLAFVAAVVMR